MNKIIPNENPTKVIMSRKLKVAALIPSNKEPTFEELTSNEKRLLVQGYQRFKLNRNINGFYLQKKFKDRTITYLVKSGLDSYMKKHYGVVFDRQPDEVYLIEFNNGTKVLKILDKRSQNADESIDNKLWCGKSLKRDFEIGFEWESINFEVEYAFCLNAFLTEKYNSDIPKYLRLNQINLEDEITVLFGEEEFYFEKLDMWINNDNIPETSVENCEEEASESEKEVEESEEKAEEEAESEEEAEDEEVESEEEVEDEDNYQEELEEAKKKMTKMLGKNLKLIKKAVEDEAEVELVESEEEKEQFDEPKGASGLSELIQKKINIIGKA